jgi:hypothetical protein
MVVKQDLSKGQVSSTSRLSDFKVQRDLHNQGWHCPKSASARICYMWRWSDSHPHHSLFLDTGTKHLEMFVSTTKS